MLGLWYFTWIFLVARPFDTVDLTLEFNHFQKYFYLVNIFWTVGAKTLMFHISIQRDKTNNFDLLTLNFEFYLLFKHFNLANNFWTVSYSFDISHEYSLWHYFPWIPIFFTLRPWPWSLTLKKLTLLITFQQRVLELWYFTCIFSGDKTFPWKPTFWIMWPWPLSLANLLNTLTLLLISELFVPELWYLTWIFLLVLNLLTLTNF